MHQPKEIYFKNLFLCLFVSILALIIYIAPNLYSNLARTTPSSFTPSYSTTPTGNPPASFSSTATLTEKAQTLEKAMATVKIVSTSSNSVIGIGSGVAIADEGYLVTNYHVIHYIEDSPSSYNIKLDMLVNGELTYDIPAELLWSNASLDVAILKSSQTFEVYANMANRSIDSTNPLKIAEQVWTLGTPFETNLFGTFSLGTISSSRARADITSVNDSYYVHNYLIQHNAPIGSGSSGGGLFDMQGNLVGLNTCGKTSTSTNQANHLYFAIPIYPVTVVLDKVIQGHKLNDLYTTPLLGIKGYDKDYQMFGSSYTHDDDGVYISEIVKDGSAFKGGLAKSDVIIGIGDINSSFIDNDVWKIDRTYDLVYGLLKYKSGDSVAIFYENSEGTHKTIVELG